jgi:hypothetical protein
MASVVPRLKGRVRVLRWAASRSAWEEGFAFAQHLRASAFTPARETPYTEIGANPVWEME